MSTSFIAFAVSLSLCLLVVGVTYREQVRGRRYALVTIRDFLDRGIMYTEAWLRQSLLILSTFFIQFLWRYVIHVSLRTFLLMLARLYERIVCYFEYNRRVTNDLRRARRSWRTQSVLAQVAEHKSNVTLSPEEKQKRKDTALAGD